jgi:ribosomal protein S18 acetylase RimI-like enzyme
MKYLMWRKDRLTNLVELWYKELGKQYPMREKLFQQNSFDDLNVFFPGSFFVLGKEGQVVGFIVSKIWQEKREDVVLGKGIGWIQAILVDAEYRNLGIGSILLQKAEAALKENGIQKIVLGRDPWHYFPGIPEEYIQVEEWFVKRGYSYSKSVHDLYRNNHEDDKEEKLPQCDDVTFRLLGADDEDTFITFMHRCFPGRWEYETIHYFQRQGTGREFVVLEKGGQIIGFCRLNDSKSPLIAQNTYWSPLFSTELGGIGPLGIDREYRKHGYGLAIVQAAIYFLHQRGIKNIVIDWTELIDFYAKLGFNVWKSYSQYEKDL